MLNTVPCGAYRENTTGVVPEAPVLTLLHWIWSVVLTGEVMGTFTTPFSCPLPPRVELAAMVIVSGISLLEALPTVTVMPDGWPVGVPTVGVTFVVPV